MPVMICPQCGYRDTANASRCLRCGAAWPVEGDNARLYYQRAGELAASGDDAGALAVVEQGLSRYDTPDLHLLAAILCRRMGAADAMRQHVAAIPVDDALRGEAEWLLRSQSQRAGIGDPAQTRYGAEDPELTALLSPPQSSPPASPKRRRGRWVALAALLALCAGAFWAWTALVPGADLAQLPPAVPTPTAVAEATPAQSPSEPADDAPAERDEPDVASTAEPLLVPTPTIPPDLVQQPGAPEQLAAAEEANTALAAQFDLAAYLDELGNNELATLDVAAQLDDQELVLTGFVETFIQREQLVALTEVVPGIESVSATELYIRPPATYTVAAGDSLWSITYNVYGDMERMADVYNANRDIMASPESLTIGMTLKLPPFE